MNWYLFVKYLHIIAVHKEEVTICYLNRTDYLPSDLITDNCSLLTFILPPSSLNSTV